LDSSSNTKCGNIYRIYHPSTNKVKVSRDVIFESQLSKRRQIEYKGEPAHGLEMELRFWVLSVDTGLLVDEDDGSEAGEQHEAPMIED